MKEDEQKAAESFAVPSAMMKAGHQPKRKLGGGAVVPRPGTIYFARLA